MVRCFQDIAVGMNTTFKKKITESDVEAFAVLSGDHNPLHLDEDYARKSIFGGRIAHGMLTASHISAAVVEFAGPGWIYINQFVTFRAPVRIEDLITTYVEVRACIPEKKFVELTTTCSVDTTIVITGTATIKSPD